jgi:F1F0 ATPase subunit 2
MSLTQILFLFIYPAFVGAGLGLFYYGGLWLILRRLPALKHPGAWMSLSLMLRLFTVLLVMYLLFADSWQQLLSAVLGMLITRSLLVKRIEPKPNSDQGHGDKTQRTAA